MEEKYAVAPHQYPDLAALVGETSDNLPGVPGVGPKTAAKWIATYGGLDGILASANDVPGKAGESLRAHLDTVRLNRELNHLLTDLDVDVSLDRLRLDGADAAAVHEVCDALQFRGLRSRLLAFVADRSADSDDGGASPPSEMHGLSARGRSRTWRSHGFGRPACAGRVRAMPGRLGSRHAIPRRGESTLVR